MKFVDFLEVAQYGKRAWRGGYTGREVMQNALTYYNEYKASMEDGEPTHTIRELARLLAEDGSTKANRWLCRIKEAIMGKERKEEEIIITLVPKEQVHEDSDVIRIVCGDICVWGYTLTQAIEAFDRNLLR